MPAAIADAFVQANGLRFHVRRAGPENGPKVLLLHGFPDLAHLWDGVLPVLAEAGFDAIAPDLRGYGATDRPRSGYDLPTLRADVLALADALGAKTFHLVGHDWGAVIAYDVAAHAPDRVQRLGIANGPHPADYVRRMWGPRQFTKSWYTLVFQLPWVPERWIRGNSGENVRRVLFAHAVDRSRIDPAEVDRIAASLQGPGAARAAVAYYRAMLPRLPTLLFGTYPTIHAPLGIVWGTADKALDLSLARHLDRWCDGPITLETMDGVGHFSPREAPARVGAFLRSHLLGDAKTA